MARLRPPRPKEELAQDLDVLHRPQSAGREVEPTRGAEDTTEESLRSWEMEEALRHIGEHHRHAIVETYLRDRPCAEVAAEAGVPEGTMRSRLYYVGSEQIPFPRYPVLGRTRVRQNGRSAGDLPFSTGCRAAAPAPPGRSSGSGGRSLNRDLGGHPAIVRGVIRQSGYEPCVLLVRGATGAHLVGQVGGVDGVYQRLLIGFSGLSDERDLVRFEDGED